jgi:hypothetical protein
VAVTRLRAAWHAASTSAGSPPAAALSVAATMKRRKLDLKA